MPAAGMPAAIVLVRSPLRLGGAGPPPGGDSSLAEEAGGNRGAGVESWGARDWRGRTLPGGLRKVSPGLFQSRKGRNHSVRDLQEGMRKAGAVCPYRGTSGTGSLKPDRGPP